jgi:6-phosphogluconolactonase
MPVGRAMTAPTLRVFPDVDRLSAALAAAMAERIAAAVRARGSCSLVLSGGRTPGALYDRLARHHRQDVPWASVHIFWGDERYVPPEDEHSNYRMARETLLDRVPVPAAHVHRMPTDPADPRDAAAAYERLLQTHFLTPWPRFDLVLLGLGDDGHTASLFPGSPALDEIRRWVVAVTGPTEPRVRLTLTLPAIVQAAAIDVTVSGRSKAAALRQALAGDADPRRCPASAVRRTEGALVWWADAAAAGDEPGQAR